MTDHEHHDHPFRIDNEDSILCFPLNSSMSQTLYFARTGEKNPIWRAIARMRMRSTLRALALSIFCVFWFGKLVGLGFPTW